MVGGISSGGPPADRRATMASRLGGSDISARYPRSRSDGSVEGMRVLRRRVGSLHACAERTAHSALARLPGRVAPRVRRADPTPRLHASAEAGRSTRAQSGPRNAPRSIAAMRSLHACAERTAGWKRRESQRGVAPRVRRADAPTYALLFQAWGRSTRAQSGPSASSRVSATIGSLHACAERTPRPLRPSALIGVAPRVRRADSQGLIVMRSSKGRSTRAQSGLQRAQRTSALRGSLHACAERTRWLRPWFLRSKVAPRVRRADSR